VGVILVTGGHDWRSLEVAVKFLGTFVVDRLSVVICIINNHFLLFVVVRMFTAYNNFAVNNTLVIVRS
jgi:hypothetical protein